MVLALAGCATELPHLEVPRQPTVTVIGDSISDGYISTVQNQLSGQFAVSHACSTKGGAPNPCNNSTTLMIIKEMQDFFKNGDADVVTFNTGIHDMQHKQWDVPAGCSMSLGYVLSTPEQYESRLEVIASYLEKHSKVVIFVDTTPIPTGYNCAIPGSQDIYNPILEKVATKHGFYILRLTSSNQVPGEVHFRRAGYELLGAQVASCVATAWKSQETKDCFIVGHQP